MPEAKVLTRGSTYYPTIGIECHVQLKTRTKLFSAVDNDARSAKPNTLISHIDLGMPGALPVLNEKVIELAAVAAYAFNTRPQTFSKFDRKHYFYPDLPMGYQITQFEEPIILGGHVTIMLDGKSKRINLTRAHLEADAGKSIHPTGVPYSLVDLNRAGTPLLEIVSEPEMHTPAEARAYAHELYLLMKYAEVSEADLYHGNMRFDVNVSVSKDSKALGTRSETKNLNSFKAVEKAVEYEIKRQIDILEHGKLVLQETRGWDDSKQKTFSQRTKEDAHDYRYFPDPDLPPIILDEKVCLLIRANMPDLPVTLRAKLATIGLDESQIETIIEEPDVAGFVSGIEDAHDAKTARIIANWVTGELLRLVSDGQTLWSDVIARQSEITKLAGMLDAAQLSSTAAKEVLRHIIIKGGDPLEVAKSKNLLQESDQGALVMMVMQVMSENPQAVEDIKNGENKAIGFLVGQVMKLSKGSANPQIVQEILKQQLVL